MREVRLVVLDMAGTTVEDGGQVPAAFTAALAEQGIALTPEQVSAVRGASKRQAIAELVATHGGPGPRGRADAVYAAFRAQLERRLAAGVREIPGAARVIAWLRGQGVRVALATGFDRDIADLLLGALGWGGTVDAVVCGDEVPRGRPAPYLIFRAMEATGVDSVHQVASVGDTALDLRAGHQAGVRVNVGVLSGAHTRAQLEREPHTHLLPGVADLPGLWPAP